MAKGHKIRMVGGYCYLYGTLEMPRPADHDQYATENGMMESIRQSIRDAEADIAAGRTTPLPSRQDFLAQLKANNAAAKKRRDNPV